MSDNDDIQNEEVQEFSLDAIEFDGPNISELDDEEEPDEESLNNSQFVDDISDDDERAVILEDINRYNELAKEHQAVLKELLHED